MNKKIATEIRNRAEFTEEGGTEGHKIDSRAGK